MPPKKKQQGSSSPNKPKQNQKQKGNENKKTETSKTKISNVAENRALLIQRAKEERSLNLFYALSEAEPEEETLEQKIRRNKKELSDNTFR